MGQRIQFPQLPFLHAAFNSFEGLVFGRKHVSEVTIPIMLSQLYESLPQFARFIAFFHNFNLKENHHLVRDSVYKSRMAIAETSQPLSIDSFSHAWSINLKPSFESLGESFRAVLDESDEAFFIDMDPRMPPSKRFSRCAQDFDFDLPVSHQSSPAAILHADELFSNGLLKPLFDPSKVEACGASGSAPGSRALGKKALDSKMRSSSLRRCRSLSKKMLDKYMDFFKLLLHKIRGSKSRSRVRAVSSSINGVLSPGTSPRASVGSFAGDWRRSCDSESSIYEAVLHCKRSIGVCCCDV